MTKVMFSFDTEDYVNPEAEEGVIRLARVLEGEGLRGCFCIVGELAAAWRERGSKEVIEALRAHEVDVHTWRHSWHPNVVEYSEDPDWDRSLARFLRETRYAMDLVMDICGRERIWAFIKPGNSFSAQAIYGSTLLGSPIFGDSFVPSSNGHGLWYCNAFNTTYDYSLERLMTDGLDSFRQRLDAWAQRDRLILYAHPCKLVLTEFWDKLNAYEANTSTWGEWVPSPHRERAVVERFFSDFRALLQMLKTHGGFAFGTYEDVWRAHQPAVRRKLDINALRPLLTKAARDLTWQTCDVDGQTYTPAELFAAAVHLLAGCSDPWGAWGVMGPVDEPAGIKETVTLSAEDVRAAAGRLEPVVYLPASVDVGRARLGPGDMLRAMAQVLNGAETVRLEPGEQVPECGALADFQTSGHWCHAPEWTSEIVDNRLRWQSWTVRGG